MGYSKNINLAFHTNLTVLPSKIIDVWKHFMGIKKHPEYLQGLRIVPLLMMSKLFLGIYYNLSIDFFFIYF
jgi:hypothetical protein